MPTPDQPRPPEGYVSSAEARRRLGIADRTLRRRVAAGTIEGEYLPRPQGSVLYVKLPPEQTAEDAAPGGSATSDQEPPPRGEDAAETAFLLDRLEAAHERERAQADRIAALERENGRLESAATHAANDAQRHAQRAQEAEARADDLARQLERERGRSLWKPWTW